MGGLRVGGGLIDPAVRVFGVSGVDLCASAPLREESEEEVLKFESAKVLKLKRGREKFVSALVR
jgi:hypothetical protein